MAGHYYLYHQVSFNCGGFLAQSVEEIIVLDAPAKPEPGKTKVSLTVEGTTYTDPEMDGDIYLNTYAGAMRNDDVEYYGMQADVVFRIYGKNCTGSDKPLFSVTAKLPQSYDVSPTQTTTLTLSDMRKVDLVYGEIGRERIENYDYLCGYAPWTNLTRFEFTQQSDANNYIDVLDFTAKASAYHPANYGGYYTQLLLDQSNLRIPFKSTTQYKMLPITDLTLNITADDGGT